jgi:hypothetical protein
MVLLQGGYCSAAHSFGVDRPLLIEPVETNSYKSTLLQPCPLSLCCSFFPIRSLDIIALGVLQDFP